MNKYILTVSDEKTTRTLANILMLCIGLFCVVLLLNELDIFVVEKTPMRIVSVIFAVIMAFPRAALLIRK
ncbi:MAG: hypothetical protein K2J72_11910, partial [Oscillospiraceae bacterium]|nr:hypothetical protein [Oscillospiraceae bacterium]